MNDFTKEELKNLHIMLERVQKDCYTYEFLILDSLSDKIQSLIKNYCKHEWESPCNACAIEECTNCKNIRWGCVDE